MVYFRAQNPKFGLAMEGADIFYGNLDIVWQIGIFGGNLMYVPRFGVLYQEKSGNPVCNPTFLQTGIPER
jgi:hypothetical protein